MITDSAIEQVHVLPEVLNRRPRLFLTPESLKRLRVEKELCRSSHWWRQVAPAGEGDGDYANDEVIRARVGRAVPRIVNSADLWMGEILPLYALSQMLDPNPEMRRTVEEMLRSLCEPDHWGVGHEEDCDLHAAFGLYGTAVAIDWLRDELSPEVRQTALEKLRLQARRMFEASAGGRAPWRASFDQNHSYISIQGLLMASIVLVDEAESAEWLAWSVHVLRRCVAAFPANDQGDFYEGPDYWDFSMPRLFRSVDVLDQCCGIDLLGDHPWFRATAYWRWMFDMPSCGRRINFCDTKLATRIDWDALAFLARRYQDPVIQGMTDRFRPDAILPQFTIWRDPDLRSVDPDDVLPTKAHYRDTGVVVLRSGWEQGATVFGFKCSPLGSHNNVARARAGERRDAGHTHPDANSFILLHAGDPLAMDDGYAHDKQTKNHNTILIDGQGQVGCGEMWPRIRTQEVGSITHVALSEALSGFCGEAHGLYSGIDDLQRASRWIVSFGERWFAVYDEIVAGKPHSVEWLLIAGHPPVFESADRLQVCFDASALTIATIDPALTWSTEPVDFILRPGYAEVELEDGVRLRGRPANASAEHRILTALVPHAKSTEPAVPFRVGGGEVLGCLSQSVGRDDIAMFAPNADEYSISGINARARCAAVSRQNEQLAGLFAADGTFLSIDGLLVWRSTAAATVAATWSRHGATGELSLDESAHITLHAPRPVSDVELCGQPVPHSYDGHSGAVEFEASAGHSAWEIRWGESNDIVTVPS